MTAPCRMKLIKAGFNIYRKSPLTRTITRCTPRGGWARVGQYTTLKDFYTAWGAIIAAPRAIAD